MRKWMRTMIGVGLLMGYPALCFAGSTWTQETTYWEKVRGKFLFGFANLNGGWLAMIHEPVTYHQEHKNVFVGLGKGAADSVLLTVGGLLHFVTAPLTFIDIPLPGNGVDL